MPMALFNILINFLWLLSIYPVLVILILNLGKKILNFLHTYLNYSSKFLNKCNLNNCCYTLLWYLFSKSLIFWFIKFWFLPFMLNFYLVSSFSKPWLAHHILLHALPYSNEMDSSHHFNILCNFLFNVITSFTCRFTCWIFTIYVFQKKIYQITFEILQKNWYSFTKDSYW